MVATASRPRRAASRWRKSASLDPAATIPLGPVKRSSINGVHYRDRLPKTAAIPKNPSSTGEIN
jgi:hypothetical protein